MAQFTKSERLRSKKIIELLFASGRRFYLDPFQVVWLDEPFECEEPARILIGVSKKRIRKASKRNYIKRRIREAYRLNKHPFVDFLIQAGKQCTFAVVFSSGELMTYHEIERKIYWILKRLQKEYEKDHR